MQNLPLKSLADRGLGVVRLALLALAIMAPVTPSLAAPKTDVVYFNNGDRLTGEIKGLDKGKLELSTSTAGTVNIEWDKVARIETAQYLDIETSGGTHYHGQVPQAQEPGSIRLGIDGEAAAEPLAMNDIVRFAPIEQGSVLKRLDGYLSVGFNYTKADNQTEFDFSGGIKSRDEIREWSLDGQATLNAQSTARTTSMYDVTLANKRFLEGRWFGQFFGSVQGNEELGLNIREIVGAGIGRYLVQDMHHEWWMVAGLAYDREDFVSQPIQNSLEGVLSTQYSFFQYDTPKRSIDIGLSVFPSLTESGRIRAEADIGWKIELVEDFFFDMSFYGSYDSKTDPEAASNSDYGVVTSLGYSF
jgi:hypothetical protein